MQREEMDRLIEEHIRAEKASDTAGCVTMYSDDIVHDVVGSPTGPVQGPEATRGFYEMLTQNITTERMDVNRAWYGDDFCVTEEQWHRTVPGEFLGIPGNGRQISFRLLHVWEFKDGRISRENVWMDGNAIVAQTDSDRSRRRLTEKANPLAIRSISRKSDSGANPSISTTNEQSPARRRRSAVSSGSAEQMRWADRAQKRHPRPELVTTFRTNCHT